MMKKFMQVIFILQVLIFIPLSVFSQDNTMYLLHQLPQANMLNPAVDFGCKMYIELPVISSIKFSYNNNGFSYKDLIRQGSGQRADSLIVDLDNVYKNLKRNNAVRAEFQDVLLGAGFHYKKYLISVRVYQANHLGAFFQKQLFALKDGNWNPSTDSPVNFNLTRNEPNAVSYLGISFGISKQFTEALRLGAKFHYIKGMANVTVRKSALDIITTEQPLTVSTSTSYNVFASMPLDYSRDSAGRIITAAPIFDNFAKNFIFNKNRGMAIDLGAVFDYSPSLQLSASILNLGFIRWKSNSTNYKAKGSLKLSGVDLNNVAGQSTDLAKLLRDTILSSFRYTDTVRNYTTALPLNVYFGANYEINSKLHAGLTSNLYIFNSTLFPSLTATLNVKPVSFIDLTGSVSYANRSLRNIGFALVLGGEPINFYFATDMVPIKYVVDDQSGFIFPYQSRSVNFRFGFNLMFGCKKRMKKSSNFICPAYK